MCRSRCRRKRNSGDVDRRHHASPGGVRRVRALGRRVRAADRVRSPHRPRTAAPSIAAADCFPFERLPAALRPRADEMLLKALDSEALYTIASDIKPMSSGFVSMQVKIAAPDIADAEVVRQILAAWTCGDRLVARLHHFSAVYDGARPLEGVVFNTRALRALIGRRSAFFAPYGMTPSADPDRSAARGRVRPDHGSAARLRLLLRLSGLRRRLLCQSRRRRESDQAIHGARLRLAADFYRRTAVRLRGRERSRAQRRRPRARGTRRGRLSRLRRPARETHRRRRRERRRGAGARVAHPAAAPETNPQ